ncbi:MAG: RNA polymerase factor sigma-54 [Hyphomicrobiaceae bacterium]|nr:RNA polymerase factor sigma-54 [Hyphomicrobiaceae bacterium]
MALTPRLEFRQTQSLVMTPQLMQAIKLLQLSNMDLVAYVDNELERNPLLDRDEADDRPVGDGDGPLIETGDERASMGPSLESVEAASERSYDGPDVDSPGGDGEMSSGDWMQSDLETNSESMAAKLDTDLGNVFQDDPGTRGEHDPSQMTGGDTWSQSAGGGSGGEDYNLEAFVAAEISLHDHLEQQLALAIADPAQRLIAQYLIDAVDEAGYLRIDLASVADKLGCDVALVEAVLRTLQGFDPAGVFARSLSECLELQLKERDRFDPAMRALVGNLELLARRDFAQLRKLCGVDDEDIADMVAEIRALDPKPGNRFGSTVVQPVVPDVVVKQAGDGSWTVELNTETLPKVLVNQTYYAKVVKTAKDQTEKSYLTDCLQTANWLVKSLDQRAKTILKVATEIVRQQDLFLARGVQYLRPLNLKMIADQIGMHESTVSRVTSNKYMATSRGIFEFKYFFTSAIQAVEGGEAHSSESVRHKIKELIDAESIDDILSDDTLVKMLKDSGMDIARRTVAKYRESLKIPSSVQRRREKMAMKAGHPA